MKFVFDVPEETDERVLELQRRTGAMTKAEVLRRALGYGLGQLEKETVV